MTGLPALCYAAPMLLLLLACISTKDTNATDDSAADSAPVDCTTLPDPSALTTGTYLVTIDSTVFNDCENQAGKGLHIHVGENQMFEVSAEGACLTTQDSAGMTMTGYEQDGAFALDGFIELEIGTCTVGITAHMSGEMTGEGTFDYRMDATADVYAEVVEGACQYIIGETEDHTFPALPCSQAWVGTGALQR